MKKQRSKEIIIFWLAQLLLIYYRSFFKTSVFGTAALDL
jgi:hypothetical protein